MARLVAYLVCSVMALLACCGRTSFDRGRVGGTLAAGGVKGDGGGARSRDGAGAMGAGGSGGASSPADGSMSIPDLDTCVNDDECTPCVWAAPPTDASQCPGYFNCCGGMATTKKRCEVNQAAWTATCPGQSPLALACPCILVCGAGWTTVMSCVRGECIFDCHLPLDADGT
jgi:hypothetical protein